MVLAGTQPQAKNSFSFRFLLLSFSFSLGKAEDRYSTELVFTMFDKMAIHRMIKIVCARFGVVESIAHQCMLCECLFEWCGHDERLCV